VTLVLSVVSPEYVPPIPRGKSEAKRTSPCFNALRPLAEEALRRISDASPYRDTKERLLNLLSFFEPMETAKVPFNSILREFIGGSIYYGE